jgi:2',3'-cyclic-nucleotide 2'-phosphodiesterase (5'-nucleotidase family)
MTFRYARPPAYTRSHFLHPDLFDAGLHRQAGGPDKKPTHNALSILFFNDLHGHLKPFEIKDEMGGHEVGGIARMAALVRDIREDNSRKNVRSVVLMAGDVLQGTPMSTMFRGEPDIKCLNVMGLDFFSWGRTKTSS